MPAKNTNIMSKIHEKAKKIAHNKKQKNSGFPCPRCNSYQTKVKAIPSTDSWPVVYGGQLMPHYLRHRRCETCGTEWKTCESIVIGSINAEKAK